jgi:K+-sensing histidine kinase KdpD
VALALAWVLFPLIGREVAALFLLSAALTAWVSGLELALLVLVVGSLALPYWFIPPLGSLAIESLEEGASVLVFGILGLGLSGLITWLHTAKQEAERNQQRWAMLLRVARHLAEEADPATVLRVLADEAADLFPQTAVTVYRWDSDDEVLLPMAGSRLADHFETTRLRPGEGLNGRVAAARSTCVLDDYQREIGPAAPLRASGARASVGVPLLGEGRLLGTLAIGALRPTVRFAPEDVATLELLASTAAAVLLGLERAQLEGVLLAARTTQHTLNNQLGLVVGTAELLEADPRVPADVRPLVQEILAGAEQAAATVQHLSQIRRVEAVNTGGPGPVLSLPASQIPARDRPSSNGR